MIEKIIIAGSGGQGIMLLGKIIAEAAMMEKKFVTWIPSYGAEVRGGTAHCMVTISDKEIGSPWVKKADILIIMNAPSLQRFKARLEKGGLLFINSSLVDVSEGSDGRVIAHPFTDIAIKLGNIKVANMVALGNYLTKKKILKEKTIIEVMRKIAPPDKLDLISININALEQGMGLR